MPPIRSQLLAVAFLTLAVFGIERLIVTDAEAIQALADETARALTERKYDHLHEVMDEAFRYQGKDRTATIRHVRGLVEKHKPLAIDIKLPEIEIEEDTATARGYVAAQVYGRPVHYPIEAELVRTEDGWMLLEVRGRQGRLP